MWVSLRFTYKMLIQMKVYISVDILCLKRGRPSTSNTTEENIQAKKKRGPTQYIPPKDIRTDNVGHWPDDCGRSRCKMPGCTGYTQIKCEKCGVALCMTKTKKCFRNFHD